jgi:hypothetical protein
MTLLWKTFGAYYCSIIYLNRSLESRINRENYGWYYIPPTDSWLLLSEYVYGGNGFTVFGFTNQDYISEFESPVDSDIMMYLITGEPGDA